LRCADLEILRAEHALQARKIGRLRILQGGQETGSQMLKPLVEEIGRAWERIFTQTIEMAETPVRNRRHLELKRRLVGKIWLGASGERYDRMRAGIADDEAWLAEHRSRPPRRRGDQSG
jgi:hypothetical protein